jgi:iron complex outermembrane recepter protein
MTTQYCKIALLAGISVGALLASKSASAQITPPAPAEQSSAVAPDQSVDEKPVGDIVVTGSRIPRPELQSAMPVSVIRADEAKGFARTTNYDALLLAPAIGPGIGETNSGGQIFDLGVANINLRNLGTNRSLVLVDGKRWVSGGARNSAVDLNTIPSPLIERYEVVTGGAAAIYGADAVSGAVNIIMKKKLSGIQTSVTTGISGEGDARQTNATIATGFSFGGDRGQFVIGGEYNDTTPIENLARYPHRISYYPNPANTGPSDGRPDNILNRDSRQIHRSNVPTFCLPVGAGCQQWYQLINNVVTAVPQSSYKVIIAGPTGTHEGGPDTSATSFENVLLRPESKRAAAYANVSYNLSDAITWNATFSYAHTYTKGTPVWPATRTDSRSLWWAGAGGEIATLANPYLPASLRDFMVANGLTSIPFGRTYLNLPRAYEIHKRDNFTIGTDLTGKLGEKLNWQAFMRYGQVVDNITTTNMVVKDNWLAGRNSTLLSGQIVCADPTARAAGCVPINFFSTDPFSQSVNNYILRDRFERTKNSLLNAGASLTGSLFSLPYGDISFAAGVEWRREKLTTRDDPDAAKLASIIWAGGLDYQRHPDLDAARNTSEVFGEVVVPVLKDLPFAKRLEFEGAYRFSHYSDNPDTHTWKLGATWEPVNGLSFRGVYSRSVRVPNFGELFSPVSSVQIGNIDDPCQTGLITQNANRAANCRTLIPTAVALPLPRPNVSLPLIVSGGNTGLTPEKSKSYTLGVILQPRFLRGFDMTIDYFNIQIDNVITALPFGTILNNCVDSAGGPDQTFCQFITRNAAGEVTRVQAQSANLAARSAKGIDIGINYRTSLGQGVLSNRLSGTYLIDQTIVAAVGRPGFNYAGEWDFPRIRATLLTDYTIGKFSFGLNTRFVSRSKYDVTAASDETFEVPHFPAYVYNDATVTFRPTEKYSLTLGVKNISDVGVPLPLQGNFISPGPPSFRQDGAANYDSIGRYFFVRVGANF